MTAFETPEISDRREISVLKTILSTWTSLIRLSRGGSGTGLKTVFVHGLYNAAINFKSKGGGGCWQRVEI